MVIDWLSLELAEITFIALAFTLGLFARFLNLPPLVGFLVAGFILNSQGLENNTLIESLSDIGITLLLFTIGLKLNLGTFSRPQVWAVSTIHMAWIILLFSCILFGLGSVGFAFIPELNLESAILIAFALSFSSTVFVAKTLEDRSDDTSLHGRIAIGILLIQDIAAVVFLVIAEGKLPSLWALSLVLLIPLRWLLLRLLDHSGHGELLVLYGFLLALGGAALFELVGMKGDLGALILGVAIASHARAEELEKVMLRFKDFFLLGFFLSIGLSGQPDWNALPLALLMILFLPLKATPLFWLLTKFRLRARTSLLTTFNLANYSEFGLIVAAIAAANGWISNQWLITLALALSFSFIISALVNTRADAIYSRFKKHLLDYQRDDLINDDKTIDFGDAKYIVLGMGGIGSGAYDSIRHHHGDCVIGIDIDPVTTNKQCALGRKVLRGDPTAVDFWDRADCTKNVEMILLSVPQLTISLEILEHLSKIEYKGTIAATTRFADQEQALIDAGADIVFNVYAQAGQSFIEHIMHSSPEHVIHPI